MHMVSLNKLSVRKTIHVSKINTSYRHSYPQWLHNKTLLPKILWSLATDFRKTSLQLPPQCLTLIEMEGVIHLIRKKTFRGLTQGQTLHATILTSQERSAPLRHNDMTFIDLLW